MDIQALHSALIRHSQAVPRYTSYPSAPCFTAMGEATYREWLAVLPPEQPVSLYLHVPYCKKLCWFCGCHTRITERYDPVRSYVSLLKREIHLLHEAIGRRQEASHIHWGGGSPTMLTPDDFSGCMEQLYIAFDITDDAEIAIEIDPRNVSEPRMASYRKWGVNRVSLGVQDFDTEVQTAINRIQPYRTVFSVTRMCRDYGIEAINLDLIYGLPKQTISSIQRTVELALTLSPNRISLFGYAHVPWKKKNIRLIDDADLPGELERLQMFSTASAILESEGYVRIGIDHFARRDDPMAIAYSNKSLQRNFQGYTTDTAPALIGIGASSISHFRQGYAQNVAAAEQYEQAIMAGQLATGKGLPVSPEDRLRGAVIASLMCYLAVDVGALCRQHQLQESHLDEALKKLSPLESDGMLKLNKRTVSIHPQLPQAARLACTVFDAYFTPQGAKHSQVA